MNSDENSLNFYPYPFPPFVNLSDYFYRHLSFCHWLSTPVCMSQTVCVYLSVSHNLSVTFCQVTPVCLYLYSSLFCLSTDHSLSFIAVVNGGGVPPTQPYTQQNAIVPYFNPL